MFKKGCMDENNIKTSVYVKEVFFSLRLRLTDCVW